MKLFEKCPVCGGDLVEKEVEKVLKGGSNTAIVKVKAEVCLHCGERLYTPEIVSRFEEIRNKQLNFVQHVMSTLKPGGRAAIVVPDNVLFADQAGEVFIERDALKIFSFKDFRKLINTNTYQD